MEYLVISIDTTSQGCEALADALAPVTGGCEVVDPAAVGDILRQTREKWDYVEEALLEPTDAVPQVRFYLAADEEGATILRRASLLVAQLKDDDTSDFYGSLRIEVAPMENQDWANSWKAYFKPANIGNRLYICPSWEEAKPGDRVLLQIDPSSSFGTGTHATTRMCLTRLDEMALEGLKVLDLGCGSGILSCAACLLGAAHALACDIEENAMRVTAETMAANGVTCWQGVQGNLLEGGETLETVSRQGEYDLILANIVPGVLIPLAPQIPALLKKGGQIILSGILNEDAPGVAAAYEKIGMHYHSRSSEEGWTMLVYIKQ